MSQSPAPSGTVASIHLHPSDRSKGLSSVDSVEFVAEAGLRGDQRYFGRKSRSTGGPSKRQVTLIERETLSRHAAALGIPPLAPGIARSNIETSGIDLSATVGRRLRVGTAVLLVVEPRTPCEKMDAIAPGLRTLMEAPNQGIIARVLESGHARIGDPIELLD